MGIVLFAVMLAITLLWGRSIGLAKASIFWAVFIAIGAIVGMAFHAHGISLLLKAVVAVCFAAIGVASRKSAPSVSGPAA